MGNKGTEWMSTDSGTVSLSPSVLQVFHLTNGNNDNVFGVRLWKVRTRTWKALNTAAWQDHA